ncbi:MAG: hypothetical protein GY696_28020, partial [Gammaproteobacteria bacterium]|nr:hypothetical protein [Gammaproteobacteria bacterium]
MAVEDNEDQGADFLPQGVQPPRQFGQPEQLAQGPQVQPAQQQLHVIANSMMEEEKKDYLFITKARDRLRAHVPKHRGPSTECWQIWKNAWKTACNNTMHPPGDTDGRRFAIKEALMGEAAVTAQSVTKDSGILTVEQMLAVLDKIFMPKTESALAKREGQEYKQHPDEPVIMYFAAKKALWGKVYTDQSDTSALLDSTRHGLASRYVRRKLICEAHTFATFEQLRDSAMT